MASIIARSYQRITLARNAQCAEKCTKIGGRTEDYDPHSALKRARFPPHPREALRLPRAVCRFSARTRTPHLPIGSPSLGHHSSGPGGLGPGGTIGPPSHTGLLGCNCANRALNLLISSLERRSFPVVTHNGVKPLISYRRAST
jgi:hypothetical protein